MGSGSLCRDKNLKRENVKKWLVGVDLPAAYFYVTVLPLCVEKVALFIGGIMGNVFVYRWMLKTAMLLVVWSNQYDNIYLQAVTFYQARTLFGSGMFVSDTCHDTDTYDYIEFCYFFKLLSVLTCLCRVRCPCMCLCFIDIFSHEYE
jgi:hypothetical protein